MRIRVRAIIKRGNTLLLVKHKKPDGSAYGTWVLPGGGVDEGEFITDAIHRELTEESGIAPKVGKLLFVHQFMRNGTADGPEFFFHVENADDYSSIDLTKTSHGQQEIAEIGFYDPRTLDGVLPEFLVELAGQVLPTETQLVIRRQGADY